MVKKGGGKKGFTYLLRGPVSLAADVMAILKELENELGGGLLFLQFLHLQGLSATTGLLLQSFEGLGDKFNILDAQLLVDDGQITARVDITLNVNDLGIVEAADNLEDGIDGTNMRQERVTQTSTGGSTTGQTGNIIDSQVSGNLGLGLVVVNKPVKPLIGDDNAGLLGVNGGEREVGRVTQGGLSDRLEECRLADVGKTNLKPLLEWMVVEKKEKKLKGRGTGGGLNSLCVELKSGLCWEKKGKKGGGFCSHTIPLFRLFPGRPR
jgi:hypothetical protein